MLLLPYHHGCVCSNFVSMKHFHGVSAGYPHACSLKLSIGTVRILIVYSLSKNLRLFLPCLFYDRVQSGAPRLAEKDQRATLPEHSTHGIVAGHKGLRIHPF